MNLLEKFALLLTAEPLKSFREVGITDGEDNITDAGRKVFLKWLLLKHGEEFKKDVVDKLK